MTLEYILFAFLVVIPSIHLIIYVGGGIIKFIDWDGKEKLKKDLESKKRKFEISTKYLDDVYTVKLFCGFMSKTYIELLDKVCSEDYELSDEFMEDFKSKYFYYIKIRNVSYLINHWNMTQYGHPLEGGIGYLDVDIDVIFEETKIDELYNGCSLEDFEDDKLADGLQKILDLLNHIEEEIIDDVIEREKRDREKYYKLKWKR